MADEVSNEIMKLEPANMELKSSYIKKSFDLEGGLWLAYTEYMRFQALLE